MSVAKKDQDCPIPSNNNLEGAAHIIVNEEQSSQEDVKDKFFVVHIMFLLLGLANFIPGSFFLTANDYYMYKFRDTDKNETSASDRTFLQSHFSAATLACGMIPGLFALIIAKMHLHKFKLDARLYFAFTSTLIPFLVGTVFVYINTDSWQLEFFIVTMLLIIMMNVTNQVGSLSLFEKCACFPPSVLGFHMVGQGTASIFNAILQIIALAIGSSVTSSATIYFVTGLGLLIFNLIFFAYGQTTNYYKHYSNKGIVIKRDSIAELYEIFKKVWKLGLMFFILLLTQSLLQPSITSLVVSENEGNGDWSDKYFTPVITFLLFAVVESLGRVAGAKFSHRLNATIVTILCLVRMVVFIFLIIFCNAQPRTHLPVLFPHDYQYIIIIICFGLTGGFFFTVTFTTIGNYVPPEKLNTGFSSILIFTGFLSSASSILSYFSINFL